MARKTRLKHLKNSALHDAITFSYGEYFLAFEPEGEKNSHFLLNTKYCDEL